MCSACITISPVRVEQRGRGVAALLDVGRVGRAHEHRAHLLADARASRPRSTCSVTGSRPRRSCARSSEQRAVLVGRPRASRAARRPSPPAARRPPGPSSRSPGAGSPRRTVRLEPPAAEAARARRALRRRRRAAGGPQLAAGARSMARDAHVHELELARPGRRSRSARACARSKRSRSSCGGRVERAPRTVQLERLARGSAGRRTPRAGRPAARRARAVGELVDDRGGARPRASSASAEQHAARDVAPAVRRRRARAPRARPRRAGRARARCSSSSASRAACIGPGAAERDERVAARVDAALDRDDAQRAQHLLVGDAHDAPARSPRRPGRARRRGRRPRARPPRGRAARRPRAARPAPR